MDNTQFWGTESKFRVDFAAAALAVRSATPETVADIEYRKYAAAERALARAL
jgi:hypothetical protein